jgi:hypothetical protein
LTSFYFSISPNEYYQNLIEEEWGCFKHVGMTWDMIMTLPIQERRAMIRKHNLETEAIERDIAQSNGNSNNRHLEGEGINDFARLTQQDPLGG